jgi:hypothetical protein
MIIIGKREGILQPIRSGTPHAEVIEIPGEALNQVMLDLH